jgi:hypothetical protein
LNPFFGYASLALLHGYGRTLLSAEANPWTSSTIPLSPMSRALWCFLWWCLCLCLCWDSAGGLTVSDPYDPWAGSFGYWFDGCHPYFGPSLPSLFHRHHHKKHHKARDIGDNGIVEEVHGFASADKSVLP